MLSLLHIRINLQIINPMTNNIVLIIMFTLDVLSGKWTVTCSVEKGFSQNSENMAMIVFSTTQA
jgi:hypothetical protein